jgi:hypothetical protein
VGDIREIKSIARPINLDNRKEKLEKRKKEIEERHEYLKKQVKNLLRK